jgi:hypothetical protein
VELGADLMKQLWPEFTEKILNKLICGFLNICFNVLFRDF